VKDVLGDERWTSGHFDEAIKIFADMATADDCEEFLTLPAYELLVKSGK